MPDEEKVQEAEKPHLLVDLVKAATERKGSSDGASAPSGSSLVIYLIIVGVAVLGFSIMGFLLVRARRKAAQLAYELRKKEEEQKQAAEDHKLAENGTKRNEAHKKVKDLQKEIDGLKEKLEKQKELAAARSKALQDATSWDDLAVIDKRE